MPPKKDQILDPNQKTLKIFKKKRFKEKKTANEDLKASVNLDASLRPSVSRYGENL
jgi:hypothetical protein